MGNAVANLDDTLDAERNEERWLVVGMSRVAPLARVSMIALLAALAPNAAAAAPMRAAPVVATAPPEHHGSVFVDPLGFLLFGPRVGVEVGAGRVAGAAYGRWFNAGVLAHSLFLSDSEQFKFSYGAGLRGRYYWQEGLTGFHAGLSMEYLAVRTESPSALILTKSSYVVPQLEVGYRLSGSAIYAGASGSLGYAFKASGEVEDLPGGRNARLYDAKDNSSVYGSANLELGVYF